MQWFLDSLPPPTKSWEVGVSYAVALFVTLSLLTILTWLLCHRKHVVTTRLFLVNISMTVLTGIVWIWCGMWDAHLSTERITSPSQIPDPFHCVVVGYWGTWVVGYGGTVSLLLSCVLKLHYITTGGGAARGLAMSSSRLNAQMRTKLRAKFCCGWWWWLSLYPVVSMAVFGLVAHYALPSDEAIQFNLAEGCVLADTARAVFTTLVLSHTVVVTVAVRMYQSATHKYFQMPPWFYITTWVSMSVFAAMEVLAWSSTVHDSPVYRTCAVVAISLSVLAFVLSRLNRDIKGLAAEDLRMATRRVPLRMASAPSYKLQDPEDGGDGNDDGITGDRRRPPRHKWPAGTLAGLSSAYTGSGKATAYTELDDDDPLRAEMMGVELTINPASGRTVARTPRSERRRLSLKRTGSPKHHGVEESKADMLPRPGPKRHQSPLARVSRQLREESSSAPVSPRRRRPPLGRSSSLRGITKTASGRRRTSPRERGTEAFKGEFEFLDLSPTAARVMEPGTRHCLAVEDVMGTPMHDPSRHRRQSLHEALTTKTMRALPSTGSSLSRLVVTRSSRSVIRVKEFINWLLESHPFLVQALFHLHLRERGTESTAATHFGAVVLRVLETFIMPPSMRWEATKTSIFSHTSPSVDDACPCNLQPARTQVVKQVAEDEAAVMSGLAALGARSDSNSPPWSMQGRRAMRRRPSPPPEPGIMGGRCPSVLETLHPSTAAAVPPEPVMHEDPFDIDDGLLPVLSTHLATREMAATAVMNEIEEFIAGCATSWSVPEWVDDPSPIKDAMAGHGDVTLDTYWGASRFVGYPLSDPASSTDTYFEAHLLKALLSFRISTVDGLLSLMPLKAALRVRLTQVFELWSLDLSASIQDGTDPLTNMDTAGMMGPASPPLSRRTVVNLGDALRGSPATTVRRMDPQSDHEQRGGMPAFGSTFTNIGLDGK